jgi:hypothetical protein
MRALLVAPRNGRQLAHFHMDTAPMFTPRQRTTARLVGLLYVLTNATAIAAFIARDKVIVLRDAAKTAENLLKSEGLFRFGVATEILTVVGVIVLVWGLYVVLKTIDRDIAWLATFFRLAENFFLAFITIQELSALAALKAAGMSQGFNPEQLQGLSYSFLSVYLTAFNIGFVFLGLGSAIFSYLWWKSGYIPRIIAGWGIFSSLLMAVVSLGIVAVPTLAKLGLIHMMPMGLYEIGLGFWLLFRGIRQPALHSQHT